MKTTLIIWLSLTTLLGCNDRTMNTEQMIDQSAGAATAPLKGPYSYLALGDSYTIGEAVEAPGSFPYQLKAKLKTKGYDVTDPKIIAVTGWTTGDLKKAITEANLTQHFDIVTLLIGVNNQYRGYSQTEYHTEFIQLLNTAIKFAGGNKQRVFVVSIPDYSVTPFAANSNKVKIASEIDQYNAINKAESLKAGVNYSDITSVSRGAVTDAALIASDGLHPSAKMYGLWADALAAMVSEKL